jgi:hypothetical protein
MRRASWRSVPSHVQAAELEHLGLVLVAQRAPSPRTAVDLGQVLGVALLQPALLEGLLQAVLEVPAQLDVGAAPAMLVETVHRALLAGRATICASRAMVLGVQHLVPDAAAREMPESFSSSRPRSCRPDGLALLVHALDLLDDRLPLLGASVR